MALDDLELQIDSPPQRPHHPDIQRPCFSLMMSSSLQKILMNPLTGYIYVHFFGISTHILADLQRREYYCDTEYCSSAARTDPPEGTPISIFFSMLVNLSHSKNQCSATTPFPHPLRLWMQLLKSEASTSNSSTSWSIPLEPSPQAMSKGNSATYSMVRI